MPGANSSLTPNQNAILVVVDGSNFFNDLTRWLSTETAFSEELRVRYFHEWFDADRLIQATLNEHAVQVSPWGDLGIVIFRSRKSLCEQPYRLEGDEKLTPFWARQGSNPCTSTILVDVPGARPGKETGVDTAVVVYFFETLESWDAAVLFSNDADFVPAVWALRRRGKRVACSSPPENRVSPLVEASQHFMPWSIPFLRADLSLFSMVQTDGALSKILERPEVATLKPRVRVDENGLHIFATATGLVFDEPLMKSLERDLAERSPNWMLGTRNQTWVSLAVMDGPQSPRSGLHCSDRVFSGLVRRRDQLAHIPLFT